MCIRPTERPQRYQRHLFQKDLTEEFHRATDTGSQDRAEMGRTASCRTRL